MSEVAAQGPPHEGVGAQSRCYIRPLKLTIGKETLVMRHPIRAARLVAALAISTALCVALGGCGGSSGDATTLLRQTFGGSHAVSSGDLSVSVTVDPSGSRTLTQPFTFTFGGPFQSRGKGQLPASNFQIAMTAQGTSGSLALLSTGARGYVTLEGTSYQLPAATFEQLESNFAQLTYPSSGGPGSSELARLGIDPMQWVTHPSVVGSESIGGMQTTHIRAGVNAPALASDLNTFLGKAAALGVSGAADIPNSISATTQSKLASEIESPGIDLWTGKSDKTVRKLAFHLTLLISGQVSSKVGGMRSAAVGVVMQYASLGQPQTISAPSTVQPFSHFAARFEPILQRLETALGGGGGSETALAGYGRGFATGRG